MITKFNEIIVDELQRFIPSLSDEQIEGQSAYLNDWLAWYQGDVKDTHHYKIYNGKKQIEMKRLSMKMASKCCQDFSNMLWNEKCDIVIPKEDQEKFNDLLVKKQFWVLANQSIQYSFALGMGALVEGVAGLNVDNKGNIINNKQCELTVDFINATDILPLIYEDKKLTDIAIVKEGSLYSIINIHVVNRNKEIGKLGNYYIVTLKINNKSLDIEQRIEIDTKSNLAWFQIIQPNISNNVDIDSHLPVSIYANSLDTLKAIDIAYDSLNVEIQNGRRKTMVSQDLTKVFFDPETGDKIEAFDMNDTIFHVIPSADGKQLIDDYAPQLRVDSINMALNEQLNIFSSQLGLGENYYNYELGKRIQTATQVISENTQLFRTLKKHEILLEQVLIEFTLAVKYICNTFTQTKFSEFTSNEINIKFDDSIIEDTESEKASNRLDVANGTMTNVEYRMKWYAVDEDTAKAQVGYLDIANMLDKFVVPLQNGLITPTMFVDIVKAKFPNLDTKGLEEYISSKLEQENVPVIEANPYNVNESGLDE